MFQREAEMTGTSRRWLTNQGLTVKSEFNTPWGICDLVGVKLNQSRVEHRLSLGQTKALGSITRAQLLLRVPDIETQRSTTVRAIARAWAHAVPNEALIDEAERLVADRFLCRSPTGRLQKMNGWLPLQDRIVAVELKLDRIEQAMLQARRNLGFADESLVAFPEHVASRVAANRQRWSEFFSAGIGLLSVTPQACRLVIAPTKTADFVKPAIQVYCVEKFWRTRVKDSSS